MKPLIQYPNVLGQQVSDLFVEGGGFTASRLRNEQPVKESFAALDADVILNLKSADHLKEDIVAWSQETIT
jgi:hypothetical protein